MSGYYRQIYGGRGRRNINHAVHMVNRATDTSYCQFERGNVRMWHDFNDLKHARTWGDKVSTVCANCYRIKNEIVS